VALAPAERALVEQRPTRSLAALLAYSRGVRAEVLKDYETANQEYRAALRIDPRFSSPKARLAELPVQQAAAGGGSLEQVAALAAQGVNPTVAPQVFSAADPAFRQRLIATIVIILNIP
jgi:hypothetical protein